MGLQPVNRWANEGPGFNRAAAEAVYSTVMKMEPDEAVMFTRLVADAMLEDDLMVHGEMIAKALELQTLERADKLKTNLARSAVSKARRGESADLELAALDELSKSFVGDIFSHDKRAERARKQQRGVGSGRFVRQTTDITHEQGMGSKRAKALNVPDHPDQANLSASEREAYSTAYHQVAEILKPYERLPAGSAFVHIIDNKGSAPIIAPVGALTPEMFDPKGGRKVVQAKVSVLPPTDEQGAVFSAFDALGMPNIGATLAGSTKGGVLDPAALNRFRNEANQPTDPHVPSEKVFRRVSASANLLNGTLGNVAPPQAKVAIAVAQHVGGLGPAAQKVVGPTLDRAAYRYRGTERAVDPSLTNAIEQDGRTAGQRAYAGADAHRRVKESEARRDARLNRNALLTRQRVNNLRADWEQAAEDHKAGMIDSKQLKRTTRDVNEAVKHTQATRVADDTAAHKEHNDTVKAAQQAMADGAKQRHAAHQDLMSHGYKGNDDRWKQSQVLAYFRSRVPSADLHELHLKAGTVPPSEGVILDSHGKVASQALGYGDDHYLPFTLGAMRKMRGGSYIRTRTWGGPTAEDIRTSLLGGAKSLTVVSNNGVFNVDFDETFKGGRRHNDKAHRMIGRYEHLLDAVRQGKVSRSEISAGRMGELEAAAAQRADPKYNRSGYDSALEGLMAEERKNPVLGPDQRAAAYSGFVDGLAREQGFASGEDFVRDIARRSATKRHAVAMQAWRKEDQADWRVASRKDPRYSGANLSVPPPASVETMTHEELEHLRAKGPEELAAGLASELGRLPQLQSAVRQADEENRDAVRTMQLNGPGYEAALQALKQQFPYYIKHVNFERWSNAPQRVDTGYVRPGSTRPAAARAGLYDSQNSGGKVAADSIRGQRAEAGVREIQQSLAAAPATAPAATAAAPAPAVSEAKARAEANENMLTALLAMENFGPNAEILDGKTLKAAGGRDIRDTVHRSGAAAPAPLAAIYGVEDEDALYDELEADPRGMQAKIDSAVRYLERAKAWPINDPEHDAALQAYLLGGKAATVRTTRNPGEILAQPNGEYDWAHDKGDAYQLNNQRDSGDIARAYLQDQDVAPLVAREKLAPSIEDEDFTARSQSLHKELTANQKALDEWDANQRFGKPPVDPDEHAAAVRGLVVANTLHRRHGESLRAENAQVKAEAAERQAAFEREQAQAPVVTSTNNLIVDMNAWDEEDQKRYTEDPEIRERVMNQVEAGAARAADDPRLRARDEQELADARRARENLGRR